MKIFLIILGSTILFMRIRCQGDGRKLYSPRYDNLDIDTIFQSFRLVTNYVQCLTGKKACPPEGKDLKRILPEALRTRCSRCSPNQKENALKVLSKLYFEYNQYYKDLAAIYDPTGEYNRRFEEYLNDLNFNKIPGKSFLATRNTFNDDETNIVNLVPIVETTSQRQIQSFSTKATRAAAIETTAITPLYALYTTTSRPVTKLKAVTTHKTTRAPETTVNYAPRTTLRPILKAPDDQNNDFMFQTVSTASSTILLTLLPKTTIAIMPTTTEYNQDISSKIVDISNYYDETTEAGPLSHLIDNFFIQPTHQRPIATIFTNIGNKLSNTADSVIGMFRSTVEIIVG